MGDVGPHDLVAVGHVIDAWGIRGEIKVAPYSADAQALTNSKEWWLEQDGKTSSLEVLSAKTHGNYVTARMVGIVDRNAAEKLKGARISIPRSRFPMLESDEFYWVDLIGLEVVNEAGEMFGCVTGLMENGVHQILEVRHTLEDGTHQDRLIPFVSQFVKTVDRQARRIEVDWGLDY